MLTLLVRLGELVPVVDSIQSIQHDHDVQGQCDTVGSLVRQRVIRGLVQQPEQTLEQGFQATWNVK